jgi:lipopolysaccharide/colanic/teichoic acid biosynthesis glycosyltransferase
MNQRPLRSGKSQAGSVAADQAYKPTSLYAIQSVFDREWLIGGAQALASFLGIVLLCPLFLLIALAIKLTDGGAVFYRGERVGCGSRTFKIYKFRTLIVGAEEKIGARLLSSEDQRIFYTRIGKFLKRSKLDELPQLFNVIRGEMRLAGPRPVRPVFLDEFEKTIPHYASRFLVPPGITGIAQLRGGYYTSPKNKLRYDRIYIRRRSLILDFQLVFLTWVKVLNRWFSTGFFVLFLFLFVSFIPAGVQPALYVSFFGIRMSLIYLLIIVVAAVLFLKKGSRQAALYRGPLNLPLLVFIVLSALSAFFSDSLDLSLQRAGYYAVTGFFVAFMIVNTLATKAFILFSTRVIALTSVVMSVLGLFQIFLFNYTLAPAAASLPEEQLLEGYIRASSLLGNPVVLAVYLVLGLPLLLAEVARASTQTKRDFWLVCSTLSFVGIFFTQTRVGLLALLVTGVAFLSRRLSHSLSFALICLLWLLFLISLGGPRFSPAAAQSEATEWIEEKMHILRSVPVKTWLIGGGARTAYPLMIMDGDSAARSDRDEPNVIPNMHITLALEHGIAGWCVIIWLIFSALLAMQQAYRKTKDEQLRPVLWAIISSVLGFLISMNAMNVFHNLTLQIFFWNLIGIGLAIVIQLSGPQRHNLIWRFGDSGDQ